MKILTSKYLSKHKKCCESTKIYPKIRKFLPLKHLGYTVYIQTCKKFKSWSNNSHKRWIHWVIFWEFHFHLYKWLEKIICVIVCSTNTLFSNVPA